MDQERLLPIPSESASVKLPSPSYIFDELPVTMSAPSHVPTGTSTAEFQQWVSEGFVKPIPFAVAFLLVVLTGWMTFGDSQSHLKSVPIAKPPKSILQTTAEVKAGTSLPLLHVP